MLDKKKIFIGFSAILLFIVVYGCQREKVTDYYVITDVDCTRDSVKCLSLDGLVKIDIPRRNWYTSLVIIFDTTDKVYVYQTELISQPYVPKHPYSRLLFDKQNGEFSNYTEYSNFIQLQPNQLVTFDSKSFVEFIKNNNDIFNIDTLDDDNCAEIFTVASIADTIKNVAFYDLERLLSKNGIMRHHLYAGLIRRTTEEENVVIYHKKNNIPYDPMKINWSQDFIDGEHAPFTKGYDSLEQKMVYKNKAINIFNVLSIKLHRVS